jgi:hypothetical protein
MKDLKEAHSYEEVAYKVFRIDEVYVKKKLSKKPFVDFLIY